jgi:two-component system LytT family response regulator
MMVSTYIIDDEPHAVAILKRYIEQTPNLVLKGCSTVPQLALAEIRDIKPDLSFVDLDMPLLSGIELTGLINDLTSVVFTTSFREYGVEAFEKNAMDYLLKPVSYERFLACIQKFKKLRETEENPRTEAAAFFVNGGIKGKLIRILTDDLVFIKAGQNYIELHFKDRKMLTMHTLRDALAKLPAHRFARIHKSVVINLSKIREIIGDRVIMETMEELPIGRSYSDVLYGHVQNSILGKEKGAT